jgi:hypothetical protein
MSDFRGVSASQVAALVRSGESSAREQAERALAAIDATNHVIHAFVAVDPARALAEADAVDRRIAAGDDVGPLTGVPIGVKDLEHAIGYVTTYGSARRTRPSSAGRPTPATNCSRPPPTRGTRRAARAARRVVREPRWPRGWFPSPPVPTVAGRSGSPRPSTACPV